MKRSVPLVLKFLLVVSIAFAFLTVGEGVYRAYHKSVRRVRETELMQDVSHVRQCINNYTQDRQQPPQSLQDLVDGNYLPEIPTDPLTEKKGLGTSFRHRGARQWAYCFRDRQRTFQFGT